MADDDTQEGGPLQGPVCGAPAAPIGTLPDDRAPGAPLVIDGSHGEGGGQILRTAVGLSAALGVDVVIENIRAGRPRPGLSFQHMAAIDAVESMCVARVTGKKLGSPEVGFFPGPVRGGRYTLDIGTAGAMTLVLQAALIAAAAARDPVGLRLTGGTDVRWSPPMDHFIYVTVPLIQMSGMSVVVQLARRGYYPKGGGKAEVNIAPPDTPSPIDLERRSDVTHFHGVAHASNLPRHVSNRMADAARERLEQVLWERDVFREAEPRVAVIETGPAMDPGTGISLWMRYSTGRGGPDGSCGSGGGQGGEPGAGGNGAPGAATGGGGPTGPPSILEDICADADGPCQEGRLGVNALGEKGVPAEEVGAGAAQTLLEYLDGPWTVDDHTADQLIPFVALFGGGFVCRELTSHALTNLWVVEQFLPGRVKVSEVEGAMRVCADGPLNRVVAGLLKEGDEGSPASG